MKAIRDWPPPFQFMKPEISMAWALSRSYVRGFSTIVVLITIYLNEGFEWSKSTNGAFKEIKERLITAQSFAFPISRKFLFDTLTIGISGT